ncbi:MAG: class I SAM-dependent methyltransferase [Rubrivivax sp.]|nr:class I SAM-dependent methyltransferase [Rubrivivax sp.]
MNYDKLLRETIDEHKVAPVDILGIGDAAGEYSYLDAHILSYVRTVRDIDQLFAGQRNKRILEIGPFLGPAIIALKKLGYDAHAIDLPEYQQSAPLQALFARHGVPFRGENLRTAKLPYADGEFDAVIACEVIEHLNFNPLPLVREINRITRQGGYFYISMPNQASLGHRIKLLRGRSVHMPIDYFFAQLDPNDNMLVAIHWREYTLAETTELLSKMGFAIERAYHCFDNNGKATGPKLWLRQAIYSVPSWRPNIVAIGKVTQRPHHNFHITAANT